MEFFTLRTGLLVLCLSAPWAVAEPLENLALLALSPVDGQAVLQLPNHKMQVLKVGESIDGTRITLRQVLNDKAIFQEVVHQNQQDRIETVWLHKAQNGASRIERINTVPPAAPERVVYKTLEKP